MTADFYNGHCPGCGGEVGPYSKHIGISPEVLDENALGGGSVGECNVCGGIIGTLERSFANLIVRFDAAMLENSEDVGYFDFYFPEDDRRSHGWFDKSTGRIVQFG